MTLIQSNGKEQNLSTVAKLARAELEKVSRPGENLTLMISQDKEQHKLMLPSEAVRLLMDVLENLALHRAVSVVASDKQLTTQEVANILRVSRPYVTKLIDSGELPCERVGTHRRIRYDDLMTYKQQQDRQRREVLDEIAAQSQKLKIGY